MPSTGITHHWCDLQGAPVLNDTCITVHLLKQPTSSTSIGGGLKADDVCRRHTASCTEWFLPVEEIFSGHWSTHTGINFIHNNIPSRMYAQTVKSIALPWQSAEISIRTISQWLTSDVLTPCISSATLVCSFQQVYSLALFSSAEQGSVFALTQSFFHHWSCQIEITQ
jgi:hypothetical protein